MGEEALVRPTLTLATGDRKKREKAIVAARDTAERGATKALEYLAVHEKGPRPGMSQGDRKLRRALRAKARLLGANPESPEGLQPLVDECAYGQLHKMLFAGFLAKNSSRSFLMHPEYRVPVSLEDCAELALEEGDLDGWATAARYAAAMFPDVFPAEDPIQQVEFFREDQTALTRFLEEIPDPAYDPDEGIGWAYQFWQSKAKKEVNESGRKIGGADLPAVTQLFTEDYMVKFLLHNTLGAWWAARNPESEIFRGLEYLRFKDDGMPAAGTFDGWPATAAEVTVMDPSAGSGHFLTAAAELLARMREEEEGLSPSEAAEAVLRDNVFGLELDERCTQIMAFALALWAWKRGGYRKLPVPHVAWSGRPAGGRPEEWTRLAAGDFRLENALSRLHKLFRDAPDLGSLIDPSRVAEGRAFTQSGTTEMDVAGIEEVEPLLSKALASERGVASDDPTASVFSGFAQDADATVFGEAAIGIARAASLMRRRYTLVATNVSYLARGKQGDILKDFLETYHPAGKADLATAFVERCASYAAPGGATALVTPQNWLFLGTYKKLRERLLKTQRWNLVARLGSGAFETIGGEVVNVALLAITNAPPAGDHPMTGLDVSDRNKPAEKDRALQEAKVMTLPQAKQLENPDARVTTRELDSTPRLQAFSSYHNGVCSGDYMRFGRCSWEVDDLRSDWKYQQSTVRGTTEYSGMEHIFYWQDGRGEFYDFVCDRLGEPGVSAWIRGDRAWNRRGVAVSATGALLVSLYSGNLFDDNTVVITPNDPAHLDAVWTFCSSDEYYGEVRAIDQALKVRGPLVQVPFDLERWQKVAEEKYPDGLPEPYSDDSTQWLFHGHPAKASEGTALHVVVARLLGYRWPAEAEGAAQEMSLSAEGQAWIEHSARLDAHADPDGVVCLPAVAGERPAAERLRALLADTYEDSPEGWSQGALDKLLAEVGSGGKDLAGWLWSDFFKQHCRIFHNRPFIWHVWDGRKDGFSALVNYHALDERLLRRLIYTYLGSWIEGQRAAAEAGETGADGRLAAALDLQQRLEAILEGEPPYDLYIRWKEPGEQPIGWNPDINDGVRLNVRPFVEAGVLRSKFTVNWKKDRGKNPDGSERHNDLHLTRAEKEAARNSE